MEEVAGGRRSFLARVGSFLFTVYILAFLVAMPYFNWLYATEHGFVAWLFLGEVVATGKAIAWPYFALKSAALVGQTRAPASSSSPHYEAHCREPLPPFTLGEFSNPTKAQEEALCACIWQTLGVRDRDVAEKASQGRVSEVSALQIEAFSSGFRNALEKCGGMTL